jgi:phytoene dehydrogenase-like protein
MMAERLDAVIVGSGPNGLAAAIELAEAGQRVLVVEASEVVGGGARSAELTLPGFVHDICSAVHPLAVSSPVFRRLPLDRFGLSFIQPDAPLAHPLDDGTAVILERSINATAAGLGVDADAWRELMQPLVEAYDDLIAMALGPLRLPRRPGELTRFGLLAIRSATGLARSRFRGERARALFAGMAAHASLPLEEAVSASFGLVLGAAGHAVGWPVAQRGSQSISDALAAWLRHLGGEIVTEQRVTSLAGLPQSRAVLFDTSAREMLSIAGDALPNGYQRQIRRFRRGMGTFKVDYALDGPVPWAAPECLRAGTIHLGGTMAEVAASERAVARGRHPERPFVIAAQQSLFDATRAPDGQHTFWAYCHVPNGSTVDMTQRIEAQIERFAPGFRDCIVAAHAMSPADMERHNPNYVGGDIACGVSTLRQTFVRPVLSFDPHVTPIRDVYLCSSATPPGIGVHGMCGYRAARAALKRTFGRR